VLEKRLAYGPETVNALYSRCTQSRNNLNSLKLQNLITKQKINRFGWKYVLSRLDMLLSFSDKPVVLAADNAPKKHNLTVM
jgi:hypothetical protein